MKDSAKFWGVLLVALLSVFFTTHFSSRTSRHLRALDEKLNVTMRLFADFNEQMIGAETALRDLTNGLEETQKVILAKAASNIPYAREKNGPTPSSIQVEANDSGLRITSKNPDPPITPAKSDLTEALSLAFQSRKADYLASLSEEKRLHLNKLTDSAVDAIFQGTKMKGIKTPEDLEVFKKELQEDGDLNEMYAAMQDIIVTQMMTDSIKAGKFSLTQNEDTVQSDEQADKTD